MTTIANSERRVVPRWREFHKTLGLGELRPLVPARRNIDPMGFLPEKESAWQSSGNIVTASELVSTALVVGRADVAASAISFLEESPEVPTHVKQSIKRLADGSGPLEFWAPHWNDYQRIAYLKGIVREWHGNAVAWTDMALLYSRVGQRSHARHCIAVALALAPSNRFVLRCAVRFFLHIHEPDLAVHILHKSGRVNSDPWLLASEIAVSQIAEKSSRLIKKGMKIVSSNAFDPSQTTELSAALGTVELANGRMRNAKKSFNHSAISPNDNVKAQLLWTSAQYENFSFERVFDVHGPMDHEARVHDLRRNKQWKSALDNCFEWSQDEGFSARPFSLVSCIAQEAIGDLSMAQEYAEKALQTDPENALLLNNLAVMQALGSKTEDAEQTLKKASKVTTGSALEKIALKATKGMILYRSGHLASGRECYLSAIKEAGSGKEHKDSAKRAALYMIQEELHAKTMESNALAKSILDAIKRAPNPESDAFMDRIRKTMEASSSNSVGQDRQTETNRLGNNVLKWVK